MKKGEQATLADMRDIICDNMHAMFDEYNAMPESKRRAEDRRMAREAKRQKAAGEMFEVVLAATGDGYAARAAANIAYRTANVRLKPGDAKPMPFSRDDKQFHERIAKVFK